MIVGTSDPLRARWSLDIEQFLHSQRVSLLIAHHGDVVQAVKVGESLEYQKKGVENVKNLHKRLKREPQTAI